MRIAVVGAGVAGLVAAHTLAPENQVTLYEAADYPGGHANTVDVSFRGETHAVDTGFMVFNRRTYPKFCALLERLGVASQPSTMSFSFTGDGVEYCGSSINTLLAQRSSLVKPRFWRMLMDVVRFNRTALAAAHDGTESLGDFLRRGRYSDGFVNRYLLPMGAAIWSARPSDMLAFPAKYFLGFFHNHGLLTVNGHPQWLTVRGGARSYVSALLADAPNLKVRLNSPVQRVSRADNAVTVVAQDAESFDAVVLACHSDQALQMLADPSAAEREVLGAIAYQPNEAVLHFDETLLPTNRRAWAAWNYLQSSESTDRVVITYNLNVLQSLPFQQQCLVTLNAGTRIDPAKIIRRFRYSHPGFTRSSVAAQTRRGEISGQRRTHYCGAYWSYGFHEDGVASGLEAAAEFERYS